MKEEHIKEKTKKNLQVIHRSLVETLIIYDER